MAVTSITETSDREAQWNFRLRKYVRTFRVVTDDSEDDGAVVLAADLGNGNAIPADGAQFPNDNLATVQDRTARPQEDNPRLWLVSVTYEASSAPINPASNPLLRRPTIQISSIETIDNIELEPWHRPSNTDPRELETPPIPDFRQTNGNYIRRPICNVVGERFTEPPQVEKMRTQVIFTFNMDINAARPDMANSRLFAVLDYVNTVNDDTWMFINSTVQPYTCRCAGIDCELTSEQGLTFWRVSFVLHFDNATFLQTVANRGYWQYQFDAQGQVATDARGRPKREKMTANDGQDLASPEWLTLEGRGFVPDENSTAEDFEYLVYHVYEEKSFGMLGLPRTMAEVLQLQP